MPFLEWDDSYSVDIDSLDNQHKKIIEMINELYESVLSDSDKQKLDEILVRLSVFTVQHFIFEENLFKKYNYEFQREHKKEHDYLSEQVTDFHKKHIMEKEKIDQRVILFFKDLMIEHIQTYDTKYAAFMNENAVK